MLRICNETIRRISRHERDTQLIRYHYRYPFLGRRTNRNMFRFSNVVDNGDVRRVKRVASSSERDDPDGQYFFSPYGVNNLVYTERFAAV